MNLKENKENEVHNKDILYKQYKFAYSILTICLNREDRNERAQSKGQKEEVD